MPDFNRRMRKLDEIQTPDLWDRAESRGQEPELDVGRRDPSPGRRLVTIGVAFALFAGAGAFLLQRFDLGRGIDRPVAGGQGSMANIVVRESGGTATATLTYEGQVREGVPASVVGPGAVPVPEEDSESVDQSGVSITALLGVDGFSLDHGALDVLQLEPIQLPTDATLQVSGLGDRAAFIVFPADGRTMFLANPTDVRLLEPGERYRIMVVGPWGADSFYQLAFDLDIAGDPFADQLYETDATVLEDGTNGPVLCLGGVQESLPPQCGGAALHGWNWDAVEGEETSGGTKWGEFHVVGTYDGSSFTVVEGGPPRPAPPETEDPFQTPCAEPAGGWPEAGPSEDEDRIAAMRIAEAEPTYAGIWIDYLKDPVEGESPGPYVLNVAFTGDPYRHEATLREAWNGPLCLQSFEHSFQELRHLQRELSDGAGSDLGLEVLGSDVDIVANHVELWVVVLDPEAKTAIESAYGDAVVVAASLTRVE